MTRIGFGFDLFEYSVVLIVIGMVLSVILHSQEQGWPKAEKWWAYPLLFVSFGALIVTSIVRAVMFVRAFH